MLVFRGQAGSPRPTCPGEPGSWQSSHGETARPCADDVLLSHRPADKSVWLTGSVLFQHIPGVRWGGSGRTPRSTRTLRWCIVWVSRAPDGQELTAPSPPGFILTTASTSPLPGHQCISSIGYFVCLYCFFWLFPDVKFQPPEDACKILRWRDWTSLIFYSQQWLCNDGRVWMSSYILSGLSYKTRNPVLTQNMIQYNHVQSKV